MPLASPQPPSDEYRQRQQAREARAAHFEKVHLRLGNLRLLLAIAAAVLAWCAFYLDKLSAWWLLVPAAAFAAAAIYHAHVLGQRSCAERAAGFYRRGLARIEDRWANTEQHAGQQEQRTGPASHLYAADLDLFGPASLFELLSQARTRMGEDTLAGWLLAPSPISDLRLRHAAIAELRPRLDLREDIAILGADSYKDLKTGVHPESLLAWAESPAKLTRTPIRWLALLLALAAIATAVVWIESGTKAPFFAVLIVEGIITAALHKRTTEVLHTTGNAFDDLRLLSSLLALIERESFASPQLQSVRERLFSRQMPASEAIRDLARIVEYINSLDNPIVRFFDIPLLYSVQTAYAAEAWRRAHGSAVRHWLAAIGEAEALLSLSAYSYEHPADPFPELIEDGPPLFHATQLGHPLIPAAKCVRNNISIGGDGDETKALLVSGSNMSGKSTLLRAIGINTVLAMAGAPVRAAGMRLTALQVGASILVNDSLQEGSSRFYAEITRLRHICDLAEKTPPLLFLLDELLQGTNSKDRLTGAQGVVRALLNSGAIGLISTHDLALTHIGSDEESEDHRLQNVHFQDEIEDGRMKFDYKLRPGIVTHSNGVELMRLIGLKV